MNAIIKQAPATAENAASSTELLAERGSPFAAVAAEMVALGWSVFPQDPDARRPASVHGRTLKPKTEEHVDERVPSSAQIALWRSHAATASVAVMFGDWSPGLIAVDVDTYDAARSERVATLLAEHLGDSPFVRVGQSPKFASLYRVIGGDVTSRSIRFADADGEDTGDALEILGPGKTLTLHGVHRKTGQFYKWIGRATPLLDSPSEVPEVDASQLTAFLAAVQAEFPAVKTSSSWNGAWNEGDAGRVRVSKPERAPGAPLARDGRDEVLRDVSWRTVRANGAALVSAEAGEALASLTTDIATAVVTAFGEVAVTDGRWAPVPLRAAALRRVQSLVAKIRSGEMRPPRSQGVVQDTPGAAPRVLPTIQITVGDIRETVDQAESALAAAGLGIYQRGGEIVRVGRETVLTAAGRETSARRLFAVDEAALTELVSVAARFVRFDAKTEELKVVTPPAWIAKTLTGRAGQLRLPVVTGVVTAPTIRPDGSLLDREGYDETTGLLVDFEVREFPKVADTPSRDDARRALARLAEPIAAFPFVSAAHRSVAMACLLTAVCRRALRTAPLFAFSATAPGSGKSLLVEVASVLATGREPGVTQQSPGNLQEDEKRLAGLLLAAHPVVTIDNVNRELGGDLLCQALTQTSVSVRPLGTSRVVVVPTSALFCATGNGLRVAGDLRRRTMLCQLDARCERPEERVFGFDPVAMTRERRPELVAAALTVLRAFQVAGRPRQAAPLGSFEGWSSTVRDALLWLGEVDPCSTLDEVRALDPETEDLSTVIHNWALELGGSRVSARTIIDCANEERNGNYLRPDFRDALLSVAGVAGDINGKRLGKWLAGRAGRLVDGCRLVRAGVGSGHVQMWTLEMSDEVREEARRSLTRSAEVAMLRARAEEAIPFDIP